MFYSDTIKFDWIQRTFNVSACVMCHQCVSYIITCHQYKGCHNMSQGTLWYCFLSFAVFLLFSSLGMDWSVLQFLNAFVASSKVLLPSLVTVLFARPEFMSHDEEWDWDVLKNKDEPHPTKAVSNQRSLVSEVFRTWKCLPFKRFKKISLLNAQS